MPLSAWLVIHQGDSSTTRRFSAPASPDRDTTPPHPETPQLPRKSFPSRRHSGPPHPVMAPEELMPRTLPPHPLHCFPLPGTDLMSHASQRHHHCLTDSSSLPPPYHEAGTYLRRTTMILVPARSGWPARAALALLHAWSCRRQRSRQKPRRPSSHQGGHNVLAFSAQPPPAALVCVVLGA
jgi:hypothetical protein